MNKNSFMVVLVSTLVTGCYASSTVNTPVGTETHRMFAGGLVSVSNVDTKTSFNECRELLKPGRPIDPVTNRPADMAMIDRDVYRTCFGNHMQPVAPMGQKSDPVPVDYNGDGQPDAVEWPGGYQVPIDIYRQYPGYWPSVFQAYGFGPTGMGPMGAYNGSMQQFRGAPISNMDGSAHDPNMQVLAAQSQQPPSTKSIESPWGGKKPATEEDLAAVTEQMLETQKQVDALKKQQRPPVTEGK